MKKCSQLCAKHGNSCTEKECRLWIDYKEDYNCTLIAVDKHDKLTLKEVAKRLGLSIVRIKQIQDVANHKLHSKLQELGIDSFEKE